MILYPILAGLLGLIIGTLAFAAGRSTRGRNPCGCLPIVLEPRADDWRGISAAEYGALRAMNEITFSEIDQLGVIAERTFGHVWERKPR